MLMLVEITKGLKLWDKNDNCICIIVKFYTKILKVCLESAIVAKAKIFAETVTSTTDYSDTKQLYAKKIKDDHFISKLGEEAVRIVFSKYARVVGPDYNIYNAKAKSWKEDLSIDNLGLAVKTQKRSSAEKYGLSWTFQCSAGRMDSVLQQPDAWVVFVAYDDLNPYTCYVYPPFQMKELTLGEPKLDKLKGHKKVVYANTLKVNK